MGKERYKDNRQRVRELYGIDPNDRRFDTHHLLFRKDFKNGLPLDPEYQDSKANLVPMKKTEHARLHRKVQEMENGTWRIPYTIWYSLIGMEDRQIEENSKYSIHKCGVCNGFGTLSYGKIVCHACTGKGYIVINENSGMPVERKRDEKQKK